MTCLFPSVRIIVLSHYRCRLNSISSTLSPTNFRLSVKRQTRQVRRYQTLSTLVLVTHCLVLTIHINSNAPEITMEQTVHCIVYLLMTLVGTTAVTPMEIKYVYLAILIPLPIAHKVTIDYNGN